MNDYLAYGDAVKKATREKAAEAAATNGHPAMSFVPSGSDQTENYVQSALWEECNIVANAAVKTRNHTLNVSAFKIARFVHEGLLGRDEFISQFTSAAVMAGLDEKEIRATINSALGGRAGNPQRNPVIPEAKSGFVIVDAETLEREPKTEEEKEQHDYHSRQVARRAYELRVAEEARALWMRQRAAALGQQPPVMVSMTDFLAVPDEDAVYRVLDLLPIGGRALLAAQYKAGKTSMVANLLRSLVDGDPFLGAFTTNPVERVLLIDAELDERMLRRWLRQQNIRNSDAINVLCLRGRLSTFNIMDDHIRAQWAREINGAQLIMLDCIRPCLDALGLSEDKEAGVFLTAFDALCKECGAGEAVVVHHMGHNSERSRGDSRLLDWPDVLWKIIRDADEDGGEDAAGDRFFSAVGRDVLVPEVQLSWQPETRALTICGGGRNTKKARNAADDIADIMLNPANADGLSQTQLVNKLKAYGLGRNIARLAVRQAIDNAVLLVTTGPRESKIHTLNPSWRST